MAMTTAMRHYTPIQSGRESERKNFKNQMLGIRDDALLKAAGVRKGYAPMKVLLFSLSSLQLFFFTEYNLASIQDTHAEAAKPRTCDGNNSSSTHT